MCADVGRKLKYTHLSQHFRGKHVVASPKSLQRKCVPNKCIGERQVLGGIDCRMILLHEWQLLVFNLLELQVHLMHHMLEFHSSIFIDYIQQRQDVGFAVTVGMRGIVVNEVQILT